jgi:hypothetical protein
MQVIKPRSFQGLTGKTAVTKWKSFLGRGLGILFLSWSRIEESSFFLTFK